LKNLRGGSAQPYGLKQKDGAKKVQDPLNCSFYTHLSFEKKSVLDGELYGVFCTQPKESWEQVSRHTKGGTKKKNKIGALLLATSGHARRRKEKTGWEKSQKKKVRGGTWGGGTEERLELSSQTRRSSGPRGLKGVSSGHEGPVGEFWAGWRVGRGPNVHL